MIIWIASYPKSGNTFVRSFLSAYYYTNNGEFNFNSLKFIEQFPDRQFFNGYVNNIDEASKNWLPLQKNLIKSRKVKFLKTHFAYGSYDQKPFTTSDVSLGGVYIVRDPRNVACSLMNHYSISQNSSIEMLLDKNRGIKSEDGNYATYSFLSSWSNHVNSWSNISKFRTMIIKYEELRENSNKIFEDLIKFINSLLSNNQGIDYEKFKKALETTNFNSLKKKENDEGFFESIYSKKEDRKIPFFNKGFKNNWKKIIDKKLVSKIEKEFSKEMKKLNYI